MTEKESVIEQQAPAEAPTEESTNPVSDGAAPQKRPKRGVIVAAALVAVLALAGGGSYFAWSSAQARAEEEQAAELAALVDDADEILAETVKQIAARERVWLGYDEHVAVTMLQTLVSTTEADLEKWSASVDQVELGMAECGNAEVAEAYLAVCAELDKAFDACEAELASAVVAQETCDTMERARTMMINGNNRMNASVEACNADDWSSGSTEAQAAKASYSLALELYSEVEGQLGVEVVGPLVTWASGYIEVAEMQDQLATYGRRGSVSSYNAQIDKIEAREAEAGGRRGPDVELAGGWSYASGTTRRMFDAVRLAADHHDDARALYDNFTAQD